jgi:hypothetical protein
VVGAEARAEAGVVAVVGARLVDAAMVAAGAGTDDAPGSGVEAAADAVAEVAVSC